MFAPMSQERVILTTLPKSGSHLLKEILWDFLPLGVKNYPRTKDELGRRVPLTLNDIKKSTSIMPPGSGLTSHLPANTEVMNLFKDLNYPIFFMIRDPREMICSILRHIKALPSHHYYQVIMNLENDEQRINRLIKEFPSLGQGTIVQNYENYLPWQKLKNVVTIQYEKLMSEQVSIIEMKKISKHLNVNYSDFRLRNILKRRKGSNLRAYEVASAQNSFQKLWTNSNFETFEMVGGQNLLRILGYTE